MPSITCIKCGEATEVPKLHGDYSTYVCRACQEKVNQPAYKARLTELEAKKDRTESEDRRVVNLKAKITGETPAASEAGV